VGVEPEDKQPRSPERDLLGFKARVLVGAVFTALYIATFLPRQNDVAAILSGVLGGVVVYLILKEIDERRKRRLRRR
jgi:uncharacterized membrane protein